MEQVMAFYAGNITKPEKPVIEVAQNPAGSEFVTVAFDEVPGAFKYLVYKGASTGSYSETIEVLATDAIGGYTFEAENGQTLYIAVKAVGANNIESDLSDEDNITVSITEEEEEE